MDKLGHVPGSIQPGGVCGGAGAAKGAGPIRSVTERDRQTLLRNVSAGEGPGVGPSQRAHQSRVRSGALREQRPVGLRSRHRPSLNGDSRRSSCGRPAATHSPTVGQDAVTRSRPTRESPSGRCGSGHGSMTTRTDARSIHEAQRRRADPARGRSALVTAKSARRPGGSYLGLGDALIGESFFGSKRSSVS